MKPDYYDVLAVAPNVDEQGLKRAYRQLARKYHPDVAADKASAEQRFKDVNEAYAVLSDPQKRAAYDRLSTPERSVPTRHDHTPSPAPPAEPRAAAKGKDLRIDLEITLREAYSGVSREVAYPRLRMCLDCERGGCATCLGLGRVRETRNVRVAVPAGVDNSARIRIRGAGEDGVDGGEAGNLHVYVRVQHDGAFRREGLDIHSTVEISFARLVLGGHITIATLGGHVQLWIVPGTQVGATHRLVGHGMPSVRGGARGDHYVTIAIAVPTTLSERARSLLEEYDRIEAALSAPAPQATTAVNGLLVQ
jgi:molecular chaperone DnaJ